MNQESDPNRERQTKVIMIQRALELFQCPKTKSEVLAIIDELSKYPQDSIQAGIEKKWQIKISDLPTNEKNSSESIVKKEDEPRGEIMELLLNPNLFNMITEREMDKKIVGETETRKVIFLCSAGGRLVENSQIASYNLLINDEAGAGKDYVAGAVLDVLPKEYYIHKTRISPAVFTYWHNSTYEPEWTWAGKVFYAEDISETVLNSDVFKVMCSKGSSATVVIKQKAHEISIKGKPVMITTTATATPSPELTRRFVILNLDSSEQQTKAIMRRHSEFKRLGIVPEYDEKYREAISCLKRVKVKIPYAEIISEHFPTNNMVMRTNYPRFLDFICASAGFYQYQRKKDDDGFLLAEGQDYDIARSCFLKLCSNKYMIPLTINQKKILQVFEKQSCLKGSASNLHTTQMSFLSLPALQTNLGLLVRYGILQTRSEKDGWNRDIEVYSLAQSYHPDERIDIPTFEDLQKCLTTLTTLTTLNTFNTLTTSKEEGGIKDIKGIKAINDINNLTEKTLSTELDEVFK